MPTVPTETSVSGYYTTRRLAQVLDEHTVATEAAHTVDILPGSAHMICACGNWQGWTAESHHEHVARAILDSAVSFTGARS